MTEVRQLHEAERGIEEALRNFAGHGANGGGRPRRVEAETAGSRLELLAENHSDANPRIDTRSHLNWGEIPPAVNYSPPSIGSSNRASGISSVIFAIGRIAIVITFIMSGLFRLADLDGSATIIPFNLLPLPEPLADAAASIEAALGLPFAKALVIAGAALEIVAGVLIAMGILSRPASIALMIFTVVGIYWFPWNFQNGVQSDQIIRALNELSIMGALLILSSRLRPRARC